MQCQTGGDAIAMISTVHKLTQGLDLGLSLREHFVSVEVGIQSDDHFEILAYNSGSQRLIAWATLMLICKPLGTPNVCCVIKIKTTLRNTHLIYDYIDYTCTK